MAIKKSELYSSLWESCNKLRGGMDASLYKDYILTLLFVLLIFSFANTKSELILNPTKTNNRTINKKIIFNETYQYKLSNNIFLII